MEKSNFKTVYRAVRTIEKPYEQQMIADHVFDAGEFSADSIETKMNADVDKVLAEHGWNREDYSQRLYLIRWQDHNVW